MHRRQCKLTERQCCYDQREPDSNYCLRQFFPANQYYTERIPLWSMKCESSVIKIRGREQMQNVLCGAERSEFNRKKLLISCPRKVNTFKDPLEKCGNCSQNAGYQADQEHDCQKLHAKPCYPSLEEYIKKIQFLSMNCLY